jgi:Protein of unknown function (DUF2799)
MLSNRISLLCVALVGVAGCAGMSEQACVSADWRTIGFEDGTLGRSEASIGRYRQQCGDHGVTPDLDAYRAGHAQGVLTYCRVSHGFEVGHSGAAYQGVCPANVEADFLAEYDAGRHLFELESALRNIDAQIAGNYRAQESIKQELTKIAATMIAVDTSAEQRVALVTRSADLGRRYGTLTSEIEQLQRERAVNERDLYDYQQTLAARN